MDQPPGYNQSGTPYPPQQPGNTPPPPPPQQPPQGYGYGQPASGPVPASQTYYPPPPQHYPQQRGWTRQIFNPAMYRAPGTGSWAAASLILAIVGWVLCLGPISWPLAMIFGIIGMIGHKSSKGMAFAGFLISTIGVALVGGVLGLGFHLVFFKQKFANEAGGPVVAAIEEFKSDHDGNVPESLSVLVEQDYLPPTWKQGLDGIDNNVRKVVEGKEWKDFLRYTVDGVSTVETQPKPRRPRGGRFGRDDHDEPAPWEDLPGPGTGDGSVKNTSYRLEFIGVDGRWNSDDDHNVEYKIDPPYDLSKLGGGSFRKQKRDLVNSLTRLESAVRELEAAVPKERERQRGAESDLREAMRKKDLRTLEEVKKNEVANNHLLFVGECKARVEKYEAKLGKLRDQRELVAIKVKRLEGMAAEAQLSGGDEEMKAMAEMVVNSQKALETDVSVNDLDKKNEADEWFNTTFR